MAAGNSTKEVKKIPYVQLIFYILSLFHDQLHLCYNMLNIIMSANIYH